MGVRHKINAKCAFEKIEHEKDECSQKQDCDEQEKQANDGQTNQFRGMGQRKKDLCPALPPSCSSVVFESMVDRMNQIFGRGGFYKKAKKVSLIDGLQEQVRLDVTRNENTLHGGM